MRWSYRIGSVAGTDIKVHVTFLLLLGWFAFEAYTTAGPAAAIDTTLFILALFACVTLHEFGHIFMARRFGVRTPDVILLPIGGVARLERIPENPKQELLIAIAGPLVTLAIALVLYLVLLITTSSSLASISFRRFPWMGDGCFARYSLPGSGWCVRRVRLRPSDKYLLSVWDSMA
jgi:Zn-dependent protease